MDGAADNGTASDAEKDAEELAEEEEEEEEGGKRKASKKKKTVAPLKIKIGAKGTPGAGTCLFFFFFFFFLHSLLYLCLDVSHLVCLSTLLTVFLFLSCLPVFVTAPPSRLLAASL